MKDYPPFVTGGLPEADIPFPGLRGWILQGPSSQLLFLAADAETEVPEHSHGAQWGIVVAGEMSFTLAGETRVYRAGDSYTVPAGVPHRALLGAGFRAIDYFDDPARYRPRERRR